jgi:hypothetical protein
MAMSVLFWSLSTRLHCVTFHKIEMCRKVINILIVVSLWCNVKYCEKKNVSYIPCNKMFCSCCGLLPSSLKRGSMFLQNVGTHLPDHMVS